MPWFPDSMEKGRLLYDLRFGAGRPRPYHQRPSHEMTAETAGSMSQYPAQSGLVHEPPKVAKLPVPPIVSLSPECSLLQSPSNFESLSDDA